MSEIATERERGAKDVGHATSCVQEGRPLASVVTGTQDCCSRDGAREGNRRQGREGNDREVRRTSCRDFADGQSIRVAGNGLPLSGFEGSTNR